MGTMCPVPAGMSRDTIALTFGTVGPIRSDMAKPRSFRDVVALWPTQEALALDVGASHESVKKWAQRGFIPADWWSAVLSTKIARSNGISAELLTTLAAREVAA